MRRLGNWLREQIKNARTYLLECSHDRECRFSATEEPITSKIWDIYNGDAQCAGSPRSLQIPFWISVLKFVLAFMFMGLILNYAALPMPQVPARGDIAFKIDKVVTISTVMAHLVLLFLAMFEGFRAVWLAHELQGPTRWPDKLIAKYWPFPPGEKPQHWPFSAGETPDHNVFDPWLDVRFIARATDPVQRIIFYPFIVLSLLMLSRSALFDRWGTPVFLVAIYAISISLVVIAALRMRYCAEKVRQLSIENLNMQLMELQARGKQELAKQVETMLKDVREIKSGIFAPLGQQPLIKAILTMAGSLSGIALLEYVNQANL